MKDLPGDGVPSTRARPAGGVPRRRGFLAGGLAAAAALGVGDLLDGQQKASAAVTRATADAAGADAAVAQAAVGSVDVVMLTPSTDTSGATNATAINNALSALGTAGGMVWLGAGTWYINEPISMPSYCVLRGTRGGVAAADTSPGEGTVITPVSGFASSYAVSAAIVLDGVTGVQLSDFTINGSEATSAVDGIAAYGTVSAAAFADLGIYGPTGNGINFVADGSSAADGCKAIRIMIQDPVGAGWNTVPSDTTAVDVHVQNAGGDGITITNGGNIRFIGCRSDLSGGSGWVIDHPGSGGGYTDAVVLVGCGTQRNEENGVRITNSSTTGAAWRDPVVISGCSFDEDGSGPVNSTSGDHTGGVYAGIWVEGNNRVWITGSTVFVGTLDYADGCPMYGLAAAPIGTDPGVPELVVMTGGHLNYAAGGAPVLNSGPATYFDISADVTSSPGYQTSTIDSRQGTAVLSAGTVTVTSPWLTAESRIFVSNTLAGGTPGYLYVSSQTGGSPGQFTISSSSKSDTSQVAWMIVSDG